VAGPTKRSAYQAEVGEDGRYHHTYRQSTLDSLDLCLERGRLLLTGEMPRTETDSTAIGTSAHAAIEYCLTEIRDEDYTPPLGVLQELGQLEFEHLSQLDNFEYVKHTPEAARRLVDYCIESWYLEIMPPLAPRAMEFSFDGLLIHEDDERTIRINGTIDYDDELSGLGDWKTAGQKYQAWEKERWAIQPTVYTLAARIMGLESAKADRVPFTYYVMTKSGKVRTQTITVYRHQGHWDWLVEKCIAVSKLVEADLQVWPKNDTSALCSPLYCGAWGTCKGKHYADGWPRLDTPVWVQEPTGPTGSTGTSEDPFVGLGTI